jgi:hypothetical protein
MAEPARNIPSPLDVVIERLGGLDYNELLLVQDAAEQRLFDLEQDIPFTPEFQRKLDESRKESERGEVISWDDLKKTLE